MNIPHLEFGAPWVLLLLLFLPIWWVWRRRRRPAAIVFSRVAVLAAGPRAGRAIARSLVVARNLVLIGLIVALARPRSAGRAEQSTTEGINIVIAFDISSSMLAVDNLQPGQLEDGTAIGTAIATAANRLRDAPGNSRVVVLLTDGVNNRGSIDPRTAAQAASAFGVKIYTIGVGTEGMAPVPVGRGVFGLRYENREVRIDEPLLTDVARTTGGRYFRARDAAALERIYELIDRLERAPVRTKSFVRYTEQFRWPLGLALLTLALEL